MRALVSLHDLMPETMPLCESVLGRLEEMDLPPVPLLVVPGKNWSVSEINRLRALELRGHELVAHGWRHRTTPRRPYHRLHALLISRDVAEHLALGSTEILGLLRRSQSWFAEHGLTQPQTYVPPAWALGSIAGSDLANSPFTRIEVTSGILFPQQQGRLLKLPLTGYEADTPFRARVLRNWNQWQIQRARQHDQVVRISLHPNDFELRIADQIEQQIKACDEFLKYSQL